ncbi:PREDICTED: synaptosomal-associated protein 25-A-like [Amphimedon queenslandica]|uniref:Synaptosomal-associated protein n=1 Tax=Amphimedon queenslandica TaxID=400682 RepID=A0A1X7UBK7_AMPQE|nr:PREDICTED: synaptosomal-associated protein 25-A-like [Amphimedon queenslandica]|eukprot:XP_003388483.1 PREDICTED: synaptosomal-associated protein 25-A-like [Amphimedon queenslandica]
MSAGEDEVRRLDQRIDEVTDETLESTRRMLNMAVDTNQIGVDTLVTLNEQGEKLDNVERRLDEMNVDLKRADKNLKEIEKVCGCCSCPGGPRSVTKSKDYQRTYGKKAKDPVVTSQPRTDAPRGGGGGGEGGYIKRVTGDEREDEMDQNLQAVGNILDNLHGIAVDMGDELDRQNVQLEHINKKAAVNEVHIAQANYRMKQQL